MKKNILIAISCALCIFASTTSFAQETNSGIVGLSGGIGMSAECKELQALGVTGNISFDWTYAISDNIALGFYIEGGAGFLSRIHPYSPYDQFFMPFKLAAGFLMEIGDLADKPWILGITPCSGLGFFDMDLVLPIEIRCGKFFLDNWYMMGEFTFGVSLAKETIYIEPAILVGYNFGHKKK